MFRFRVVDTEREHHKESLLLSPLGPFSLADSLAGSALRTIWADQKGFADARRVIDTPRLVTVDQALAELGDLTHFGPILRPDPAGGSGKANLPSTANVLWLDYDGVDAAEWARAVLEPAGLLPTVVVFSGRGHWFYFKLSSHVPIEVIEDLNRGLVSLAPDGGDHCHDATRVARCPGRISEKYLPDGKIRFAHVVTLNSAAVYEPEAFRALLESAQAASALSSAISLDAPGPQEPEGEQRYPRFPWYPLNLPSRREDLWYYLQAGKVRPSDFPSRSEAEMALVWLLIQAGRTDKEIADFFWEYRPARWWARKDKHVDLARMIQKGREDSKGWSQNSPSRSPLCIDQSAGSGCPNGSSQAGSVDRLRLVSMIDGQTYTELCHRIVSEFGVDGRTAEKTIADLRETGVLRFRRSRQGDTRKRAYVVRTKCDKLFRPGIHPLRWRSEAERLLYPRQRDQFDRAQERARQASDECD